MLPNVGSPSLSPFTVKSKFFMLLNVCSISVDDCLKNPHCPERIGNTTPILASGSESLSLVDDVLGLFFGYEWELKYKEKDTEEFSSIIVNPNDFKRVGRIIGGTSYYDYESDTSFTNNEILIRKETNGKRNQK